MENRKKLERKHFILIGVFFFTAILTFFTMQLDAEEVTYTNMSEATLPTISFVTDNGKSYNTLHGYAQEIDPDLDNEYITPIGTDRHVKISINSYGTNVKKIHYKVRDLDNNELYENTELKDFTLNNDYINADFTLKNLIDDNKRYSLEIILSLDNDKEAHYYATFIKGDSYPLEDYINFALNFNSVSFDPTRVNEISSYLETSSSNLNDNFGHVDITSSSSMITWGDMEPYLEGEIAVSVKEINSDYAVICLDYRMGAQNLNASYDTYKV